MNTKISIHILAEALANRSGKDAATCEKFIKELFGTVTKGLENNEPVHINGLGIFSRSVSESEPVTFVPDTIFSDTVNAPFAIFQPEELNDEVTEELLETVIVEDGKHDETVSQPVTTQEDNEKLPASEYKPLADDKDNNTVDTKIQESTIIETPAAQVIPETVATADESAPEPEDNIPVAEYVEDTIESIPEENIPEPEISTAVEEAALPEPTIDDEPLGVATPQAVNNEPTEDTYDEEESEYVPEPKSGSGFKSGFITGLIVGIALGAMAVFMFVMLTANDTAVQDEESDDSTYIESVE